MPHSSTCSWAVPPSHGLTGLDRFGPCRLRHADHLGKEATDPDQREIATRSASASDPCRHAHPRNRCPRSFGEKRSCLGSERNCDSGNDLAAPRCQLLRSSSRISRSRSPIRSRSDFSNPARTSRERGMRQRPPAPVGQRVGAAAGRGVQLARHALSPAEDVLSEWRGSCPGFKLTR